MAFQLLVVPFVLQNEIRPVLDALDGALDDTVNAGVLAGNNGQQHHCRYQEIDFEYTTHLLSFSQIYAFIRVILL